MSAELLTLAEVARRLRVSDDTVYRLAASGKLPGTKVGRAWRFRADAISTLLPEQEVDPEAPAATHLEERIDFRDLYENSPDMCLSVDAKTGCILCCNTTALKSTGFSRHEVVGRPVWQMYDPACRERSAEILRQFRTTGEVRDAEMTLLTKSGGRIEVSLNISAVRDAEGRIIYSRSVWRDITAQKSREQRDELLNMGMLESIVGDLVNAVLVISAQGNVVYLNQMARQFLHLGPSESTTRADLLQMLRIYASDGATLLIDAQWPCARALRGEAVAGEELLFVGDDGARHWMSVRSTPLRNSAGNVSGCVSVLHNLIQDKRREHLLRLTEFSVTHSPDAVFWVRSDGRVAYVNDRACESLGYTREELLQLSVPDFDPDVTRDKWPEVWAAQKQLGHFQLESWHRTKQGRTFPMEVLSTYIEFDGVEYAVAHVRDISGRRRLDAQLKESEARFQRAIAGSRDGLWDWDISSGAVWFSPQYMTQLDYGPDDLFPGLVDSWRENLHPEDVSRVMAAVERHLAGVAPFDIEYRMRLKSGEYRWFHVKGQASWDDDGQPTRMAGSTIDITQHKLAKKVLIEARQQADAANLAKSEFLANMSHEIRTPLTAILGFTEIVKERQSDPETAELCATIERNGAHLLELINDILDLSKVEAGRIDVLTEPCSPALLVMDIARTLQGRATQKQLTLDVEIDPQACGDCLLDVRRVRQMLINLLGNAVKFTEQGRVTISLKEAADGQSRWLDFTVKDTGIGISADALQRLFEPFSQVDSSSTRTQNGTGLGLCISRRLARLCGGDITVQSRPNHGSVFTLRLPLVPAPATAAAGQQTAPQDPDPRGACPPSATSLPSRILVADDAPDNRCLLAFILRKVGMTVTFVENGRQLVDLLSEPDADQQFDVVFVDMQMPVLDGYGAVSLLRKQGCPLPLIALTANAMESDRRECLAAGCDDFVAKPIVRQVLLAAVTAWHGRRHIEPDRAGDPGPPHERRAACTVT